MATNNTTTSQADDTNWSLFPYTPNKAAPIFFAFLLTLIGLYNTYQSFIRYHWRKFGFTMTWATLVWISGFICRTISVYNPQHVGIFIAQIVLVLMGPPLYAAAEYFILGRLLAYLPYHAPIHPGRVFSTFMILSTVVESLTANGAANSAGNDRSPAQQESGWNTLKAALILQCFVELLFISLVGMLQHRCHKNGNVPKRVRPVFYMLYITSTIIIIRCVVRCIEGFEISGCLVEEEIGHCGYVSENEWVFYVFEVANVTGFVIMLVVFHPGRYLPRSSMIYLDPHDNEIERVGPGFSKADKRPRWQTVVDPFNLRSVFSKNRMRVTKFWDECHPIYDGGDLTQIKSNRPLVRDPERQATG